MMMMYCETYLCQCGGNEKCNQEKYLHFDASLLVLLNEESTDALQWM